MSYSFASNNTSGNSLQGCFHYTQKMYRMQGYKARANPKRQQKDFKFKFNKKMRHNWVTGRKTPLLPLQPEPECNHRKVIIYYYC